jgi:glycosyltransferase involved in cell wall biosynthesis
MHITYLAFVEIDIANACVVHTREMCEQFIALEHDVTLILPRPLTMQSWQGVRHIWVRWWGFDRPRKWIFFLESAWRLWSVHRRRPIKVLYVREMDRHPFLAGLVQWLGIPMVVEVNGWALDELRLLGASSQQSYAFERCQRKLFSAAKGIMVSTIGNAENVIAHYGISRHKVQVQDLGTNNQHFKPGDKVLARQKIGVPMNAPIILFAGSFHPHHDLTTLLKAHAKLVAQGFEALLLLVGNGNQFESIQQHIELSGLGGHIRLCGACPYDEVPIYFRAADIGVVPLTVEKIRQQQGSLASKLWDYMACHLPVVVTDLPHTSSAKLLKDKAYIVQPENVNDMARGLRDLLENAQLRQNLAIKGHDYVRVHKTWRRAAEDTVSFIQKRLVEW